MLTTVNGVPAHVLLVHAVVVLIPLAALLIILSVTWPAARRRLSFIPALTTLVAVGFIPLATNAGEWLRDHVQMTPQIARHVELGDSLTVWAGLMFIAIAVYWFVPFAAERGWTVPSLTTSRWFQTAVGTVAVVLAVVCVVQVYRIGDSGAKAAWHDKTISAQGGNAR
jgi:hypothetical protein